MAEHFPCAIDTLYLQLSILEKIFIGSEFRITYYVPINVVQKDVAFSFMLCGRSTGVVSPLEHTAPQSDWKGQ
jgi:hypothetical protein